jgi:hypothetical protein
MKNYPDRPLLDDLTPTQREAIIDGAAALKEHQEFNRRGFDRWMRIARGVAPLCELADRPGTSRKARKHLLKDQGYGSLNESTVSRLRWMAKLETAIRVWRDTLTPNKRDTWNSPTSICNRCPAVRKAMAEAAKDKPARQRGKGKRNPAAALEAHLDKLLDLIAAVDDLDNRRALIERVTSSVARLLPQDEPPSPSTPIKPKRKSRAKAKAELTPESMPAPGFTKTAEQALTEERANTTYLVAGGIAIPLPTTKLAKAAKAKLQWRQSGGTVLGEERRDYPRFVADQGDFAFIPTHNALGKPAYRLAPFNSLWSVSDVIDADGNLREDAIEDAQELFDKRD